MDELVFRFAGIDHFHWHRVFDAATGEEVTDQIIEGMLDPNVKRTPKLSWSSSDESVAVIDETGRVKVLAEGEAELTVLLENGVTGSVTITANKKPERLELKESELTLKKGGVFVLEAKTFPEGSAYGSIEWKSKDPDILSVDEDGVIKGLAHGRTTVSAKLDCGLTAYADVLVYEFGFDILADLILRTGEVDYESECCFLALDHEQETDENGILVHKYTELIWYPDDEAISICCDIYDDDIERYYELSVDFYRDERYNAYIYFHCMLDAAGGAPMVPLVFSDGDETEAQAGFYLPNYVPGASAVFQWYNGEASFRDTAQEISDHMLEYALNKLKEKWGDLGLDITPAEALNLERL